MLRRGATWLVVVLLAVLAPAAAQTQRTAAPHRIEVTAHAIEVFDMRDSARRRFGSLDFRGGLELTSKDKEFGGLSSIRMEPDGRRFLAVSDKGNWLRGRIIYRNDHPDGIDEAEMAPVLGPDGRALAARGWYDTESIAQDGGTLYVGIERVNRIVRLNYGRDGLRARATPIPVPPAVRKLPYNKGLEALVFVPRGQPLAGTLIAISERGLDAAGHLMAFLIGGPSPGQFAVARHDEFDISDAALLPSGEILLLERRFNWLQGVAVRIRRIPLTQIRPGVVVDGRIIFEADLGYQIDNMEGLAVHRAADGTLILTMISDDNFSSIQRTLLLQFALVEE